MRRKPDTIAFWVGRLPHWEVVDGRYFITLHLVGAIPETGRYRIRGIAEQLASISDNHSPDWLKLQRRVFAELERWLDHAETNLWLREPAVADMIIESIDHRHSRGDWNVLEYVVMPTHIHLFCEIGDRGLKWTLEDFKRWTGHDALKLVKGQSGRFWQREWFDHWSRSDEEDERIVTYVRNNPVKAGLARSAQQWPYSSASRSRLPDGT